MLHCMGMRRYAEWAAPAALADAVACLWSAVSWTDAETLVVPDAQAHLTRECARLAGVTPAALARLRADG